MLKSLLKKSSSKKSQQARTAARNSSIRNSSIATAARSTIESLETRRLLAAWSWQDQQIGLDKEAANYPTINGTGQTVVVIDEGGVALNHYALAGKIAYSWNFDANTWDTTPYDNNAHGTGVAGEAAGLQHTVNGQLYQGVAPGAKVIALKATGTWNVKQAFDWVVANRAKYNIVGVNYTDQSGSVDQSVTYGDLTNLYANGVFVSGPVGNYGPGPAYATYNHEYYQVGSVNASNQLSSFTPRGSAVDFVAPGENVEVTWYSNGTNMDYPSSGTSWASPQVVGLAALIKQVGPGFSTAQVIQIMKDSSTPTYDSYSNASYSMINVNAAVALAFQRAGYSYSGGTSGGLQSSGGSSSSTSTTTSTATGNTAFLGTPFSVGQVIKAVNFDKGGEGVAYHDTTNWNEGGNSYRSDNVDIGWTNSEGGTQYVGWTHAGEWLDYTVNVATAGTYNVLTRFADGGSGSSYHLEVDGKAVTGQVNTWNTGGWDNYQTSTASGVALSAGQHTVRLVFNSNDQYGFAGNFSTIQITGGSTGGTTTATGGTATGAVAAATTVPNAPFGFYASGATTSSVTLNFYDNSDNETSYVIERAAWNGGSYSVVGTVNVDAATTAGKGWRNWTDYNLGGGTTYYYRISAVNAKGSSSYLYGSAKTN